MAEDRYTKLLSLPPQPRPLNYYQLLGLPELTDQPANAQARARELLARLAAHAGGPDHAEALALMAEIGEAVNVLTDAARKADYDRPLFEENWRRFQAYESQVARADQPLTETDRRRWVEMGLGLGLPWPEIYKLVDEAAARHASGSRGNRPAVTGGMQVSLEEADRIFRCLALGAEIVSHKSAEARQQLAEAGARLGLPEAARTSILYQTSAQGPAAWQVPVPAGSPAAEREKAFGLVVRGALLGRLLAPPDEARLQEVGQRAHLTPEVVRRIVSQEMQRTGTVRMKELETEVEAMTLIGRQFGDTSLDDEAEDGQGRAVPPRQRALAIVGIAILVAAVIGVLIWALLPGGGRKSGSDEAGQKLAIDSQDRAATTREQVLRQLVGQADLLAVAREAMSTGSASSQRLAAVRRLAASGPAPAAAEVLGWVVANDPQNELRLAAVAELGKLDYAAARPALLAAVDADQEPAVIGAAGDLLSRRRDVTVARQLLPLLTAAGEEAALAGAAYRILHAMTDLELVSGAPVSQPDRDRYGYLVTRWIAAGGPARGAIWDTLPTAAEVLQLPEYGAGSQQQMLVRLVELGQKGNPQAWDRLAEIVTQATSRALQPTIAKLLTLDGPQPRYLLVIMLGRLDPRTTAELMANLNKSGAVELPAAAPAGSRLAGLLYANRYRAWFRHTYPDFAASRAETLTDWPDAERFRRAATQLESLPVADRVAEAPLLMAESRTDPAAASLLVLLLRDGQLPDEPRRQVLRVVAALGSAESYFFLVEELTRTESLSREVQEALTASPLKERLAALPAYADDPLSRYLAWHRYMKAGLDAVHLMPEQPFLVAPEVSAARLPVLVPKEPPRSPDEAARRGLEIYGSLLKPVQVKVAEKLVDYSLGGDEVATIMIPLLKGRP